MKIFIMGALGRMGRLMIDRIDEENGLYVSGGGDTRDEEIGTIKILSDPDKILDAIGEAEMVVDFSYPTGTDIAIKGCERHGVKLVTGTTGLIQGQQERLGSLAKKVAVVQAANFSIGITLLNEMTRLAAKILPNAETEIIEKHHRNKKDAPSGTALALARTITNVRKQDFNRSVVYGREGNNLKRGEEVGIHSLRGGSIVGDHDTHFILDNEILTFSHRANSREIFADGAIRAIRFGAEAAPGLWSMRDVLGLNI